MRVHFLVIEGNRKRPQVFEGVVIKRQGSGARETFTVRKQSFGVGVERTFPLHSPKIEKLEVASRGRVRRAKLYYLRGRVGKAARVAERRWGIDEDMVGTSEAGAVDAAGEAQEPVEELEATEPEEAGTEADGSDEVEGTATAGDETAEADADGNGDSGPGEPGGEAADAEPTGAEASGDVEAEDEPADGEQNEKDQA